MAVLKAIAISLILSILVGCAGLERAPAAHAAESDIQMRCLPYPVLAQRLADMAGETPIGAGVQPDGNLMQHFASRSGTWTLVVVVAEQGLGCVLAHGTGWQAVSRGARS